MYASCSQMCLEPIDPVRWYCTLVCNLVEQNWAAWLVLIVLFAFGRCGLVMFVFGIVSRVPFKRKPVYEFVWLVGVCVCVLVLS